MNVKFAILIVMMCCTDAFCQELRVKKKGGLSGFFMGKEQVIDYKYEQADRMPEGDFIVKRNGMAGVVSEKGIEVIPSVYESIDGNSNEGYLVRKDGLIGVLDPDGAKLLDPKYDEIQYYSKDSISLVKFEGRWCILKDSQYIYDVDGVVFSTVDQMPLYPGCDDVGIPFSEVKTCSYRKMLEYVYSNIKYPKTARRNRIEGTVVISFTVATSGEVQNPKIAREIGGGCGEEALRVVSTMSTWIPARHDNMNVATKFNLPVKFRLAR